jgi:hypothetical protein
MEVMNGVGGQAPQDTVIASKIANTDMGINLGDLAIGRLADGVERHGGKSG